MIKRVSATELTVTLIDELVNIHGPVLFHQSGAGAVMSLHRGAFSAMISG